jgi:hypothetical protein
MFSLFLLVCGRVCVGVVGWSRRVVVLHLVGGRDWWLVFLVSSICLAKKKGKKRNQQS